MEKRKLSVWKILKFLFIALILIVFGGLMLRLCTMGDPPSMEKYAWTESMISFQKKYPDNFNVQKINENGLSYQYLASDGKFAINNIFITETGGGKAQIQFTVRYNNSTIKYLKNDYNLLSDPIGEPFIYILTDTGGNMYRSYLYTKEKKTVYNYRHIIFDDVDISDILNRTDEYSLMLDIYYIDDVSIGNSLYGSMPVFNCIYNDDFGYVGYVTETYNIKKDMYKNDSPTSGLMVNPAYLILE